MPVVTTNQKALLRTHPHTSLHYLAVLKPASIVSARNGGGVNTGAVFTALVDSVTVDPATASITEITYKGSAGQWQDADQHFTLWVGTDVGLQDKGRVRLRKNTNATKLFPAECNHIDFQADDHLTVHAYIEPTVRYRRQLWIPGPPESLTLWIDWDVAYTDQNLKLYPVAMMGPTAAADLVGTPPTATVAFDGSASYGMAGATIADGDHDWIFPSGTPATFSGAVPGNVTWAAAGQYLCSLTVVDSKGKSTTSYRIVFVDYSTFYEDFEVGGLSASLSSRGWRADFDVFGDADIDEFPDGTMVVLVTQEWYGATLRDFGGNHADRHNIRYVGWIMKDTTTKDPETSTVRFETSGILGVMDQRENFSIYLEDKAGSPTNWYGLKDLTVQKALHHYLYWHSTLFFMTDVDLSSAPTDPLFEQAFALASVPKALDQFLKQAHSWWGADRTSCIYFQKDPDLLAAPDDAPAARNAVPTTMTLEHQDWVAQLELPIEQVEKCGFLYVDGMYYTGGADQDNVEYYIAYAPGRSPDYFGGRDQLKGCNVPATQIAVNKLAGLLRAQINNPMPRIPIPLAGNYAVFDIVPVHWTKMSLVAGDTRRGIVWSAQRLLPRQITESINNEAGSVDVRVEFSKEAYGPAGVTGDYPSDDEPEPDYTPPVTPVTPIPETIDSWGGIWVLGMWGNAAGNKPGILRTEDLGGAVASVPVWAAWNTGIDIATYPYCRGIERDPWHANTRIYSLMASAEPITAPNNDNGLVLYRREYSSGAWGSWTVVLDETVIEATLGYAITNGSGYISRMKGNINAEGHLYAMVTVQRTSDGLFPQYFFKSTNYGATWTATLMGVQPTNLIQVVPMCVEVGMLKGTSGYAAGQVIYCGYRNRSAFYYPTVCISTNQGGAWANVAGTGGAGNEKGTRIQVDPNDQSIFYTIYVSAQDQPGALWKFTAHGGASAAVAAFGNVTRPALCKVGLATTMHCAAQTALKVSTNSGTTVTSIAVTSNIAGCGIPLNWDWNLLMALHSFVNGVTVSKAIQISPDGGITWFDKTGNIDNDWPNCSGAVNVGFCLDD